MIRLTLFGGLDLIDRENQSIHPVLQQPKRLALLVYLALGGPGAFRRRDAALALFWPDSDEEHARRALNQTVHFLRRSLGPDVVVSRGPGEIGTSSDAVWCDATAFDQALKRGDAAGALSLYRAELLPGFFIDAGPDFERWLDEERNRFRRAACQAAWKSAESAEHCGQFGMAAEYARRSVEMSLNDETSAQNLLRLLDRIGDRAGALQAYDAFAAQLVQEYEAEPSVETRQLVARIRSRTEPSMGGSDTIARPIPPGNLRSGQELYRPDVTLQRAEVTQQAGSAGANRRRLRSFGLMALVGAACVPIIWNLSHRTLPQDHTAAFPRHARVTIGRLANLGTTPDSTDLGSALTAAIIGRLAEVRSFDVVSEPLVAQHQTPDTNHRQAPQLLVTGSILESGGRLRVNVQIADAVSGRTVRTAELEHASGEPLPLVDALSRQISSLVRSVVGHEVRLRAWSAGIKNEEAYELMQQADEDRDSARRLARSGELPAAVRALESADSLLVDVERVAPGQHEPIVERAYVFERLAMLYLAPPLWNSTRVEALLRRGVNEATRAVSLSNDEAVAFEALGSLSYWYWLVVPLPPDSARLLLSQAEKNLRRAVAADPSRASAWSLLSASLYGHADYAGAYLAAERAYRADAFLENSQEVLSRLFLTSYEVGDDSASTYWCEEINHRFKRSWTGAYCQLSLQAWNGSLDRQAVAQAWRIAADGDQPSALARQTQPRLHMLVAAVLARSGLHDSAESVIRQSRNSGAADPELLPLEADAQILLGRPDLAVALLTQYVGAQPLHRMGVARSRRFAALSELPRHLAGEGMRKLINEQP